MSIDASAVPEPSPNLMGLKEFLVTFPPNTGRRIGRVVKVGSRGAWSRAVDTPTIELHCSSEQCDGARAFDFSGPEPLVGARETLVPIILTYVCRNCQQGKRIFALIVVLDKEGDNGRVVKIGEAPAFGEPLPNRLLALVGQDRDLLLKGRQAENQGLGIGAFTYYRRVVENQWRRLISQILKVAERNDMPASDLERLRSAAAETQLSKAVDLSKDVIPAALLVKGENPLSLLYAVLSKAIHNLSDDECLRLASTIRLVLAALAERIQMANEDWKQLNEAIEALRAAKSARDTE